MWLEGAGRRWVWLGKGSRRDPCGNGNVLCLDRISVSILIVLLYYRVLQVTVDF